MELTTKQRQAIDLLTDDVTDYIGYGGSAGCFSGETLVKTINGYIEIKNIKKGDVVLSFNETTKTLEYKNVEKKHTYSIAVPPKMIIFADNFKCTYNHELLFNGKWTKAGELRERAMEAHRLNLLHINNGATCNKQSQGEWKTQTNDACTRQKGVFKNCFSFKWEKPNSKNTQACSGIFYSKPFEFRNRKSQRLQQNKQLFGEFGMDDSKRKQCTRFQSWSIQCLGERTASTLKLFETWGSQWTSYFNRANSKRNKVEIQTSKIHERNVSKRIWSESLHYKGCYLNEKLGAREITLNELINSKVDYCNELVYDLTVEDNHNYVVTESDIIVHNSGKSVLGCLWLMEFGYYLAGAKFFIGRDSIKDTRASVLKTWSEIAAKIGFKAYKFNDIGIIFDNGTEIELLDLTFYPYKDPLFERLGSKEYTSGWIEEASQVHYLAYEVLKTRVGRWKNETVKSKILCTFNPKKNWVDSTFYRPFINQNESEGVRFIYALPSDNPYLPKDYIKRLHELKDEATKQRLLFGNFDYDDDPTALLEYSQINEIWGRQLKKGRKYITCDVARYGSDKAVVMVWDELTIIDLITFDLSATTLIEQSIRALSTRYGISMQSVVIDEDGVGGGVVDHLKGCKGFVNNSKPENQNYSNLKTECGYKLAELFNQVGVIATVDEATKQIIETELGQLKTFDSDKDNKLKILPKDKIKENIGRSPDYLDNFIMRMYFEISKSKLQIYG